MKWLATFGLMLLALLPTSTKAEHYIERSTTTSESKKSNNQPSIQQQQAQDASTEQLKVNTGQWNFRLAMGAGYRSNPLYGGKNLPLWLIPDVSYYGEKWFFDNGRLGFTAWHNEQWSLSSVLQLNEEKGYFIRNSASNWGQLRSFSYTNLHHPEMNQSLIGPLRSKVSANKISISDISTRPTALDAGLQLNYQHLGYFAAAVFWHDVSRRYHGEHAQLQLGHQWQHRSGMWSVSGGLRYKSQDLIQRYYGISDIEADRAGIQPWQASHSWQPLWQLQWQYPLTANWQLHAMWQQQRLDEAVTASPIVESSVITRWFVGASYRFW